MKCKSCGASLPLKTTICQYCGISNDIDLRGFHEYTINIPESDRICPSCNISMKTLDLKIGDHFYIEQCDKCFGLFFDIGELERILDESVSKNYSIDFKRLKNIEKEFQIEDKIVYKKCPVCQELMNRKNYGTRSGVVIDICSDHGIWLNGGELRKLMEWKNAGGMILHKQRIEENNIKEVREKELREKKYGKYRQSEYNNDFRKFNVRSDDDIISSIGNLLFKFLT